MRGQYGTQRKHVAQNHIAFDLTDSEITLRILECTLGVMKSMPPVVFTPDMPVIKEIVMKQSASDQCPRVNLHMQSVRQPYGQDCYVHGVIIYANVSVLYILFAGLHAF